MRLEHRDQAGLLGHAHDAEPERHDADQAERDLDGGLRGIDRRLSSRAAALPVKIATISAIAIRPNQM